MKIGIMGLKADPPHWMHFLVAELARIQHKLDRVYVVTAGQPVDKKDVTDKEVRHAMVVAALKGDPHLIPSRVEVDREGPSYMADTLRECRKMHGEEAELFLIIGDDRAPTLVNWHQPDEIIKLCTIIVSPRLNQVVDKEWLRKVLPEGARFDTLVWDLSSTFVRNLISQGHGARWLLPPGVADIVAANGLYVPGQLTAPTAPEEKPMSASSATTITRKARRRLLAALPSILDNDLYKFSMANAVLALYPNVRVKYKFTDRRAKGKWTKKAVQALQRKVSSLSKLRLTPEEREYCEKNFPWINRGFWDFLANYRYDASEVKLSLDGNNNLQVEIAGLWCRTIFWEVPLLALISETWYEEIDTNWNEDGQDEKMEGKAKRLFDAGAAWGDFGTRRRRHLMAQERVVVISKKYSNFTGTSNVYLAMKHGVKALGTMAHEWIMAHSALFSLKHANKCALEAWNSVYKGNLGTALPDTFGTDAFLRDFNGVLARLFDSVRHDSGDPYEWAEKMIAHYTKVGVDWKSKPLGFTDGNTDESAIALHNWVKARGGRCWFGIGTSMSNDYGPDSPAVSIVIKLVEVTDPDTGDVTLVVKISDTPEKASGDEDAKRVALYMHFGVPLDADPVAFMKAKKARTS